MQACALISSVSRQEGRTAFGVTAEPAGGVAWLGRVPWCSAIWSRRPASCTEMSSSSGGEQLPLSAPDAGRWVWGFGCRVAWHASAMDKAVVPVRDLTDSDQNQAVLEVASALAVGRAAAEGAAAGHGPAVAAEAMAAARSRRRLGELTRPIHLTVVWAMYGETGRMVPRAEHPHGEDFVRAKVRQLDWLTGGLPGVTWSIIACDDGCPDQPSSADLMTDIAAAEGYPGEGHRSVTVLRLADLIGSGTSISPAFGQLTSTDQSRKGGSILAGMAAAVRTGPVPVNGTGRHVICYTDADLS